MSDKVRELISRITDCLANGGLFNMEMMELGKVTGLLVDCRRELEAALAAEPRQEGTFGEGKYDEVHGGFKTRSAVSDEVLRKTALELERCDGVHIAKPQRNPGESGHSYQDRLRHEVEALKYPLDARTVELLRTQLWGMYADTGWSGDAACIGEEHFGEAVRRAYAAGAAASLSALNASRDAIAQMQRDTREECQAVAPSTHVSKRLVLDWLGGYAGPQEPEFFEAFLKKLEWRIANEAPSTAQLNEEKAWRIVNALSEAHLLNSASAPRTIEAKDCVLNALLRSHHQLSQLISDRLANQSRAVCSCGFTTQWAATREQAEKLLAEHAVSEAAVNL